MTSFFTKYNPYLIFGILIVGVMFLDRGSLLEGKEGRRNMSQLKQKKRKKKWKQKKRGGLQKPIDALQSD